MPDKNFEQQARDMVNGFEMKPKPGVWQNVRNSIQEPRRKRRFVLWWWLLPLGLLGVSIIFYTLSEKGASTQTVKTSSTQQKASAKITPADQQTAPQTNRKPGIKREDTTGVFVITQEANRKKQQPIEKSTLERIAKQAIENDKLLRKADLAVTRIGKQSINADDTLIDYKNAISPNVNEENKPANDSTVALENQQVPQPKDSLNTVSANKDSAFVKTTSQADSAIIITPKKQKKLAAFHWGIIAEGGIAARKSSVLSLASFDKSNDAQSALPFWNLSGSGVVGLPSSNGFYYRNSIKHGAAIGLGIALQKNISHSIDFFTDVAYHYQSFHLTTATYKDSLILNNSFATFAGSYKATQSFHFASLFAGFNWHFINTKHIQFGISAGVDNLFLLASKQKIDGTSSSLFTLADAVRISDSTFNINNFYKYQPSLFTGILINIKTGNKQLQLIPFTRSSFRPFDKNSLSNNNHLFSTGLRAVYFFR